MQEGWGFSAYIETGAHKILFDTGNDPKAFFSNSEKMGIKCTDITDVVFSHKHHDHTAGYREILEKLRDETRIYLPKGFFKSIPKNLQIFKHRNFMEIGEDIFSLVLKSGFFLHEQVLILHIEKGLVIITGCAYPGIVKILKAAQAKINKTIYFVLGGFHLFRKDPSFIKKVVNEFRLLGVQKVAPCHCSGMPTSEQFQKEYHQFFYKIGTGSVLKIN